MVSQLNLGSGNELATALGFPLQEKRSKLTDAEAKAMLDARAASGQWGRDPVHLILEKQWFVNIAFYIGLQNFDASEVLQDIDPNFTLEDAGYIANHIQRIVAQNVARKTQRRPDWSVIPRSTDIDDQLGAKAAESVLDYFYDHMDVKRKRREGVFWGETCGTWFFYIDWDKNKGAMQEVFLDPGTGNPVPAASLTAQQKEWLNQVGAVEKRRAGDWHLELASAFQVRVPHKYESLDRMPWLVLERFVSLDDLWDKYGNKAAEVPMEEIGTTEDNQYWRRLSSLVNRHGFTLPSRGGNDYEGVTLREMWIPPSARFPKGFKVVGTRTVLMENGPHPFAKDGLDIRYPLIDIHDLKVPGRFWSMGTVEHLLGPQKDYNRGRFQTIQQRDVLSVPQWLVPKQANITSYRNDLGDVWEYDQGFKPELQNPPTLGQAHFETVARAREDMQVLSAQSDVTQAQVPSGLRSGVMARALQERDQQAITPSIESQEEGIQNLGSIALKLFWKYGAVPRAIHVHGELRQADVIYLKGADLNENFTVKVRQGSMRPQSRVESLQTALDLVQQGVLNMMNPKDRRYVLQAAELGTFDHIFEEEDLQRRRARIENLMFLKPDPGPEFAFPDVDPDDDPQAHYEEHLKFKLSDAYEKLPPIRKLAFQAHMDKHKMQVANMLEAQFAMQGMGGQGGSPPREPGQASQPREREQSPGTENSGAES